MTYNKHNAHIWRGIDRTTTRGNLVSVRLSCGHVREYPKSRAPSGGYKGLCRACEQGQPQGGPPIGLITTTTTPAKPAGGSR